MVRVSLVMPLCINCGPSVSFSQFGRTSWVAGLWFKDCAGRGLAGNLTLVNGIVLRVIGVYGPSGASLPGFDSMAERVSDERPLVSWVCSQLVFARTRAGTRWWLVDLNSVAAPSLDCWGSSHVLRPRSLASSS